MVLRTKRDATIALGALTVGIGAGAFGWSRLAAPEAEPRPPASVGAADETDASDLRAENAALRSEVERLTAENATLTAVVGREAIEQDDSIQVPERAPAPFRPILAGGFEDRLDGIDFQRLGELSHEIVPLLSARAEAIANGERPSLEVIGKLQSLNGGLIKEAGKIAEAGIAGSGLNGAYTHPSIEGNRIAATLDAAGLALTEEQRTRLGNLMNTYGDYDRGLRVAEASREIALETLVEEVEYKQRFFEDVRAMLGEDQVEALGDPAVGERLRLGINGPGMVLATYARPMRFADRDGLVNDMSNRVRGQLGLGAGAGEQVREVVDSWARQLPQEFFEDTADPLENNGMMRTARVRAAASRQLALQRLLLDRFGGELTPEQRDQFTRRMRVLVPLPQ